MTKAYSFIDGDRIRKTRTVRSIAPIYESLATGLGAIPELRYIKLFPQRLSASNALSTDGKNNPVVNIGAEGIVGVELLVDVDAKVVQFYCTNVCGEGLRAEDREGSGRRDTRGLVSGRAVRLERRVLAADGAGSSPTEGLLIRWSRVRIPDDPPIKSTA